MIENYLLEELVIFAKVGTLAKTAEELDLTQPAVTHSMKKLEDELNVKLFERKPNKIYLTETGKYTAREAKILLNNNIDFVQKVQNFDQNQVTITVAANAPGPMIVLRSLKNNHIKIKDELIQTSFESLLAEEQVTCFLTNTPLEMQDITSIYLGTEDMSVNLPANCPLAQKKELCFKDLKGKTFLSPSGIGFWQKIYENQIPDGTFIYQNKSHEYSDILNYSVLPYFTTNITKIDEWWGKDLPKNRVVVPLRDKIAHQKFYACFLRKNRNKLLPLINKMQDQWNKVDDE